MSTLLFLNTLSFRYDSSSLTSLAVLNIYFLVFHLLFLVLEVNVDSTSTRFISVFSLRVCWEIVWTSSSSVQLVSSVGACGSRVVDVPACGSMLRSVGTCGFQSLELVLVMFLA